MYTGKRLFWLAPVLMALVLALMTPAKASATDFITQVTVIGGNDSETTNLWNSLISQGWTGISYDLNKGAGGDYIYLLYKKENNPDGFEHGYITGFYIKQGSWPIPDQLTDDGRTYHLVPYSGGEHFCSQAGDLNSNTGGNSDAIHLYYTTDPFPDFRAVTSIYFDSDSSGAVGKNGDTSGGYNLNEGCKSGSAQIYMHITTTAAPPFLGAGTSSDPYRISTSDDWDRLANYIAQGKYADKFYKLTETFTASTLVGTGDHPFCGTFDGDGKTLALNISGSEAFAAPFRYVNGATIKNLSVVGSCTGGIHAAGLVGSCAGTVSINHCVVAASVSTSASHAGGFVGHGGTSTLTIENSYFSGTIGGFTSAAGGILGWCDNMTLTMNNCLFKGSFSPGIGGSYHPIGCYNPEKNVTITCSATYYLKTLTPTAYYFSESLFRKLSKDYEHGSWDSQVTAADGQSYYVRTYGLDLPYSYGFENNNLNAEGWKLLNSHVSAIISDSSYGNEGDYCLRVSLGDTPHYLISPELNSQHAISMTFSQKIEFNSTTYRLGYSTTTNDISSFIWGNYETCSSTSWEHPQKDFPKGTKYIAFEFSQGSGAFVLDEFLFAACDTPAPDIINLTGITDVSATLSWSQPGTDAPVAGFAWQYKKASDSSWSTEVTTNALERSAVITGLSGYTVYDFRVKALYEGSDPSVYLDFSFRTSMQLPFECGFEDDGDLDKWTMKDVYWDNTRVYDVRIFEGVEQMYARPRNGNRSFCFHFINVDPHPQYLISPQFNGTVPILVSFYYRNKQADIWEKFQVGVSYSDDNISSFAWGPEISALNGEWLQYENLFNGGGYVKPRYIAIKYITNNECLYLDDVIICEGSTSGKPANLTFSGVTNRSATLTWTAPSGATGYAYRYKLATGSNWSEGTVTGTSVTLEGLSASTSYDFRVKALYEGSPASNEIEIRFLTEGDPQALPYYETFDSEDMGGWRLVNGDGDSRLGIEAENYLNAYFLFAPYYEDQFFISPELASDKPILMSFFYKEVTDNDFKVTKFCVGWSKSTKDISAFSWEPEVEATDTLKNYILQVPQGTRYVAVRKKDEGHFLYVDNFSFIDADQYSIEVVPAVVSGGNKFVTTFYHLNYPFQLPEGSRAYTAFLDGDELVFRLIGDDGRIIPGDTPCIIISDPLSSDSGATSKTLILTPLLSTDVKAHDGNILLGYSVDILTIFEKVAGNYIYVLDIVDGVLGLYRFVGDKIPPRKVYILLPYK